MDGPCTHLLLSRRTAMSTRSPFNRFFEDAVRLAANHEIARREAAERSYQAEQYQIQTEEHRAYEAEYCLGDYSEREEC